MKLRYKIAIGTVSLILAGYFAINPTVDRECRSALKEIKETNPRNAYVSKLKKYYGGSKVLEHREIIDAFQLMTGKQPNRKTYVCLVLDVEGTKINLYLQDGFPFYLGNTPRQNMLDVY